MSGAYDIAVIGGGPAGTSAAITAARAGARVLLLERGSFPRQKVCGEFVSSESLELLQNLLGESADTETSAKTSAMLRDAVRIERALTFIDGQIIETQIAPAACSIPRYEMDAALWRRAQWLGVDAREQVTIGEIVRQGGLADGPTFLLQGAAERFAARAVINASGRWSNFKASAMQIPAGPKWIGLKGHFAETSPHPALALHFFKGGYCGVSPIGNGQINACAMVRADVAKTLAEVFVCDPRLAERSRAWKAVTKEVTTAPLVFHTPSPVAAEVLLAGDAAGFIDPFVGDGISMALHSGAMAARALVDNDYDLAAAALEYQSEYERRLLPAFKNAARLRSAMALPQMVRWPAIKLMKMRGMSERLLRGTRAGMARRPKNQQIA